MISKRTKDALAAEKRRGVKLDGDRRVTAMAKTCKLSTEALQKRPAAKVADFGPTIAETPRGSSQWTATQVSRVLARIA
jgi:hypothetical protein